MRSDEQEEVRSRWRGGDEEKMRRRKQSGGEEEEEMWTRSRWDGRI